MKSQYSTATSLDGFIATVDDSLDWFFPLGDAANGKNVWIVGDGELVGQFHDAGLLDEIIAQVGSVTLGAGKPLLPRAITSPPLKRTSARAIGTGFVELRCDVPTPQV